MNRSESSEDRKAGRLVGVLSQFVVPSSSITNAVLSAPIPAAISL